MIVSEPKKMAPKRILLKPAPPPLTSESRLQLQSGQQIIVLPSNFIQQINGTTTTFKIGKPAASNSGSLVVNAAAVKRPSTVTSDDDDSGEGPVRKRANLDHLTPEEKMMRRKLKNRVAAQNARDKKRTKMDDIEIKLKELEEANAKLLLENESLRALNERLMETPKVEYQVEYWPKSEEGLTPPHSDCSGSERSASPDAMSSLTSSDCSLVDSRSFESAELINASQQKSQDRGWAGLRTAVTATMVPAAAFCPASSFNPSQQTSSICSTADKSQPVLPLKKRQLQETPPP